ncbi:MAG: IclR family transcriptional regulator [Alphaproteobacteria bacterium]
MARRHYPAKPSPAAKLLEVLWAVARRPNTPLVTLAAELGLKPPTAHRITSELERLGYLQRVPGSRKLTVSTHLVERATDVLAAAAGAAPLQALLRALSEELGEMCSLGIMAGDEIVYVASAEPRQPQTLTFRAGRRAPLYCTSSGKLFLAALDDASLAAYLGLTQRQAFTRHTITAAAALAGEIARARKQGYAATNQEYVLHIVGAAVPVRDASGRLIAALSVAAPTVRLSIAGVKRLVPRLKAAAERLGRHFAAGAKAPGTTRRPARKAKRD